MKREALVRELRRLARERDVPFRIVEGRGKGSHWRIHFGKKFTIVKSGELTPTYVRLIRKQLEID